MKNIKLVNTYKLYSSDTSKRIYEVLINGNYHQLSENEYSKLLKNQ